MRTARKVFNEVLLAVRFLYYDSLTSSFDYLFISAINSYKCFLRSDCVSVDTGDIIVNKIDAVPYRPDPQPDDIVGKKHKKYSQK